MSTIHDIYDVEEKPNAGAPPEIRSPHLAHKRSPPPRVVALFGLAVILGVCVIALIELRRGGSHQSRPPVLPSPPGVKTNQEASGGLLPPLGR